MGAKYQDEPIVPVLGTSDGNGGIHTMQSTLGNAIGAASVLFRSEDGKSLNGVFDDKTANRIVDELMANIDAYANKAIAMHNADQEEKRKYISKQKDWHDSPDAMVWAEKFREFFTENRRELMEGDYDITGLMLSWFANAMAASSRHADNALSESRTANLEIIRTMHTRLGCTRVCDKMESTLYHAIHSFEEVGPNRAMTPPRSADYGGVQIQVVNPKQMPSSETVRRMIKDNPQA